MEEGEEGIAPLTYTHSIHSTEYGSILYPQAHKELQIALKLTKQPSSFLTHV